jgi:hypothetical protein
MTRETRYARSGDVSIAYQVVDTAGDGFLATFDGPARAVRCARAVSDGIRSLDLVAGSGLSFQDRGLQTPKGVPGEWHLFALQGGGGRS